MMKQKALCELCGLGELGEKPAFESRTFAGLRKVHTKLTKGTKKLSAFVNHYLPPEGGTLNSIWELAHSAFQY
jgi:hypothetical protein